MSTFDIIVPLFGFVIVGAGIAYVRWLGRRLDREISRHPGE